MPGLQRTSSIRPKRGVSSGTGARLTSSATRQRAASSAAKALKRTASVRENAVIATAVGKAEDAIFRAKEEKWFHVEADQQAAPQKPTGNANTNTSVLSFSTTSNKAPNLANTMGYCGHTITNLKMLRLYTPANGDAKLVPYALDGKKATPTMAQIAWTINRNYVRNGLTAISGTAGPGPGNHHAPPAVGTNDSQLYQNLPIRCRMIRVTPKLAPGVTLGVDPTTDLFLDQKGLRYSPNDASWGLSDNEYARVNTRNYTVLGDTKFTLGQPITAVWAAQFLDPDGDYAPYRQDLSLPSKTPLKRLVTKHQLTAKKGGQCHYVAGSAGTTDEVAVATSGQRREYIFMHFWYECGDGSVSAGGTLPTLVPVGVIPDLDAVKVHFRVESRFKEE